MSVSSQNLFPTPGEGAGPVKATLGQRRPAWCWRGSLVRAALVLVALAMVGPSAARAQAPAEPPEAEEASPQPPAGEAPQDESVEPPRDESAEDPPEDPLKREPPLTGSDLVDDDFEGSWPMFGENTRIKIGGYVKADFLYDFDGTLDPHQFLMATIPVKGTPEYANAGYVSLFAAESRFNIDVRRTEKDKPPLRAFIEGDFWPSGKSFRLRHAYAVAGDLLIGQTWTTLTVLESLPFTIDFGAGDALFGGRTTQFRYQRPVSARWKIAAAVESLDYMGIENPMMLPGRPSAALPELAVRADYRGKSGLLVIGSSVGQLRWDGGATGPDARALQWDVLIAGRRYLGKGAANYVTWNITYGRGSGENVMAFAGSEANAVLTEDGRLETMPAVAFVLGFMHKWSNRFSSNLTYAYGWLDAPESRAPLALKRGGIGHVNLIWQPTKHFFTGIEYIWGAQRTTDDSYGAANRVQAMVKVDF